MSRDNRRQVSRVEDALTECWQLHRSDSARRRRPPHHPTPPSPSPPLPPIPTAQTIPRGPASPQQFPSAVVGSPSPSSDHTLASRLGQCVGQLEAEEGGDDAGRDVSVDFSRPPAREGTASVSASAPSAPASASPQTGLGNVGQLVLGGGGLATTRSVGPAEYLQWLGDTSSMLVHEQWRKEVHDMKLMFLCIFNCVQFWGSISCHLVSCCQNHPLLVTPELVHK